MTVKLINFHHFGEYITKHEQRSHATFEEKIHLLHHFQVNQLIINKTTLSKPPN